MFKWSISPIVSSIFVIGMLYAYEFSRDYDIKKNVSESARTKEWQPLFNGHDFEGWNLLLRKGLPEEISKVYAIDEDGSLHFFKDLPVGGHCIGSSPNLKCATHGIMVTKRKFSKYHLKFEYKWGKKLFNDFEDWQYDSGVFVHISEIDIWPVGLQYQIRYDHLNDRNYSGEIRTPYGLQWYSSAGKTFELPVSGGVLQTMNDGWKSLSVFARAPFHGLNDQWNKCEIIVMGNEYIIFKLNGQIVNIALNLSVGKGPIALEAETGEIYWRNVMIKEFDNSVPMIEFLKGT